MQLCAIHKRDYFIYPSDRGFTTTSQIGKDFKTAEDYFISKGKSDNEAYSRALASVLNGSGISLLKKDPNGDFKKIGESKTGNTPLTTAFKNEDCK